VQSLGGKEFQMRRPISLMALSIVVVLAFVGVANGKLRLTRERAYNANLTHAKGFCAFLNANPDPDIGTCTGARGKCLRRLSPTAFSCQERFALNSTGRGNYVCTDLTKVTLRRGVGVKAKYVEGTLRCFTP
jgi:hypothetical protein